tara:strand:+ start:39 stop:239 length:201 start_codon:yes stop_codon:yes gene_type:complete
MPQIKIRFAKDGSSQIETVGFTGSSCQNASEFIEKALGHSTNDEHTAEFYKDSDVHEHLHIDDGEQ